MNNKAIKSETSRLEDIAFSFSMFSGFNGKLEKYRVAAVLKHVKGKKILDIGCADGHMVKYLAKHYQHITAVDGSGSLIQKAKKLHLKNVDFVCSLFESFHPTCLFDAVILSDILEHVDKPTFLMEKAVTWVKKGGILFILCPNAYSLHRRIGVLSGMLKEVHDLNATDLRVGHRRVYDLICLKTLIQSAGLRIEHQGGIFLKPLSNDQMEVLSDRVIDAFYEIGNTLPPEFLAEIFILCRK